MLFHLDLILRGAFVGVAFLAVLILAINPMSRRKSLSVGAVEIALICILMLPDRISETWPDELRTAMEFGRTFSSFALAWFVYDVFMDAPQRAGLGRVLLTIGAATALICTIPDLYNTVLVPTLLVFYVFLLAFATFSGRGDLVESRRQFRVIFVMLIAAFGIAKTIAMFIYGPGTQPFWVEFSEAAGFFIFSVIFAIWALRPGRDAWAEELPFGKDKASGLRLIDQKALNLIKGAMDEELWRREGLTIGAMADDLGLPEHRLRLAINRDLGFRNFSSFVNGYRIDAAKEALSSPEQADRTILEIAYDCGFASLAPFNKAFRAVTGQTPRDYRRTSLQEYSSIPA